MRNETRQRWPLLLLLALAALCSSLNWLKLGSFWGDAPRAWFEIYRASLGQIPYRDFTWPYPPLTLAICSPILRLFGATFPVAQITVDLLSLACVLGVWFLARRLVPPLPALAATVAFTLVGATNGGNFALFSLGVYTPAILVGAVGLMLAAIGLVDYLRDGLTFGASSALLAGGFICCLSRPECVAAILLAIACLALVEFRSADRSLAAWLRPVAVVSALLLLPSVCAYAVVVAWIGLRPVAEGITAYGLASSACPWWPTGFGLLGAAAALCAAVAAVGLLALVVLRSSGEAMTRKFARYLTIPLAAVFWLLYSAVFFKELTEQQSIRHGLLAVAYFLISTNTFLLPVMWMCCLMFAWEAYSYLRPGVSEPNCESRIRFVLLGLAFGLSTRNLFNTVLSNATTTTPMLYPVLFVLLPVVLPEAFSRWSGLRLAIPGASLRHLYAVVSIGLCLYGAVRLAGYGVRESRRHYEVLHTGAGPIRLADNGVSAAVYDLIEKETQPGEAIADVGYGGGLNFALHRSSPLYTTQFSAFRPTREHRQRDYDQLNTARTRFVVGQDPPIARFGTDYRCAFPHLVWKSDGCPDCSKVTFPVMQLIQERYRVEAKFGEIAVYGRTDGSPSVASGQ